MSSADVFCPLPWISLSLRNNGQYRVCCPAGQAEDKGLLRDASGRELRADRDSVEDVRNAEQLKSVRQDMLAGRSSKACVRCIREESAGVASRRLIEREIWKKSIDVEKARRHTLNDGTVYDLPLEHLDLRFGNRCNLKCRSCNPTESSKWLGDHLEVWGPTYNESTCKVTIAKTPSGELSVSPNMYDWHDDEFFWAQIELNMDRVRHVYFAGGEPFLIDRHFEFLEKCVATGRAGQMVVEYNTNLTLLPKRALELWSHFERVQFGVSVDGIGAVNDYIRAPSKWETIERNLHILDQAPGNFVIWLATTVMVYNIMHLPELLIWKMDQKFRRVNTNPDAPLICPHPLHGPPFLNVQMLSASEKRVVEKRLRAELPRVLAKVDQTYEDPVMRSAAAKQARAIVDGYAQFMWKEDRSQLKEKFAYYTKSLDRLRGQSMSHALPELAAIVPI